MELTTCNTPDASHLMNFELGEKLGPGHRTSPDILYI